VAPPAGGEGSPYVSQQFGYSIAFGDPWQLVSPPEIAATYDSVSLSDGSSRVDFVALAEALTPSQCMDRIYQNVILQGVQGLLLVVPHAGDEASTSTDKEAVEVWDFSFVDNGQQFDNTFYARCLVLEPGKSVLIITQEAPHSTYPSEAALREELLQGLTLPQ
jgi:hypothetical protein